MRPLLILLALTGCASTTVVRAPHKPAIPVEWRSCPEAPRLPVPPGRLRTIEEVAAWARRVVTAYEQAEADRDVCARNLGELVRMVGDE